MIKKAGTYLRVFGGIVFAVLIAAHLYFTKAPPFSFLEKEDKKEETSQSTAKQTSTESTATVFKYLPIVVGMEELDYKIKDGEGSWSKTFTIVNPSYFPVTLHLFLQDMTTCPDAASSDCVKFEPQISVERGDRQQVTLEFKGIQVEEDKSIDAKFLVVGGGLNAVYSFKIEQESTEQKSAWGKFLDAPLPDKVETFFLFIVFLIIVIILYIILYWTVFPYLLPSTWLPLRMEIGDDADSKKLWSSYSDRVRELKAQGLGRNMVAPQEKNAEINLPGNLGKEGQVARIILDLLAWILPRRGTSMRMQLVDYPRMGKGISVSLLQNQNSQIRAHRIFWASAYSLDPEKVDIERLLMPPIVYWMDDTIHNKKGSTEEQWQSLACCSLAGQVWSLDTDLARKLYVDALFHDHSNRQAKAGLGRIWVEASQGDDVPTEQKDDYLRNGIAYLDAVGNPISTKKESLPVSGRDALWFASRYNMAVACSYQYNYKAASDVCNEIVAEVEKLLANDGDPSKDLDLNRWLRFFKSMNKIIARVKKLLANDGDTSKDLDLIRWLKFFKPMAVQFQQSMLVKTESPSNISRLEEMINDALEKVAAAGKVSYAGSKQRLLVNLDYRSQYNTACFFSRCYDIARQLSDKGADEKAKEYAELALGYLRLALGHGGGLAQYVRQDQALRPIRTHFRKEFDKIAPAKEETKTEEKPVDAAVHLVFDQPLDDSIRLLPGITAAQIAAFEKLSIRTKSDLLLNGIDVANRRELQKKTKATSDQLLWWLNLTDLTRVPGLDLDSAILLEGIGKVDTVKELRTRNAGRLFTMLDKRIPKETLSKWISSAKDLISTLEY